MSFYYLGQIYYRNNLFPDAKSMFLESIKIDPANYRAHYFLGLTLRQIGDHDWAVKEFEIAQKNEELRVKCFLAKGSCYLERNQMPKAIMELERGLKFARRGSDTELNLRYYLAECQEKMRDFSAAIFNWEKIHEVNNNFKDVSEKLKIYSEFRQDDRIKDFLISGLSQFEHDSRKIVEGMGNRILDCDIISDTEIELTATDSDGKWRNTRQTNKLFRVIRTTDVIQEKVLRKLSESMKPKNASRIIIIATGDFSQQAIDFANTRPIELLGKVELIQMLRNN
jgi:tetratricopeptide (TPR) repeat protein